MPAAPRPDQAPRLSCNSGAFKVVLSDAQRGEPIEYLPARVCSAIRYIKFSIFGPLEQE